MHVQLKQISPFDAPYQIIVWELASVVPAVTGNDYYNDMRDAPTVLRFSFGHMGAAQQQH